MTSITRQFTITNQNSLSRRDKIKVEATVTVETIISV